MFAQSVKILWIFVVAAAAQKLSGSSRIVGGGEITIDKIPYIVSLRYDAKHNCGGTLISAEFVLTAAHCFDGYSKDRYVVVAGATTLSEAGQQRKIRKLIVHPEYNEDTGHMDVAFLKLDSPMVFGDKVLPMELCDMPLDETTMLQVSGWGFQKEGFFENLSEHLRTVKVAVMAQDECVQRHIDIPKQVSRIARNITDSMVCAWGEGGRDACTFDSGGPGIYADRLCAIVSWGVGCGRRDYPGVYTRIDAVRDFIEKCKNEE